MVDSPFYRLNAPISYVYWTGKSIIICVYSSSLSTCGYAGYKISARFPLTVVFEEVLGPILCNAISGLLQKIIFIHMPIKTDVTQSEP